jgi:hypothetical protein
MIGICDEIATGDMIDGAGCTATARDTFSEVLRVEIAEIGKATA